MKVQHAVAAGLGLVLLVVLSWFLLLAPRRAAVAEQQALEQQAIDQQGVARARIRSLEAARSRAPDVEALLAASRAVVPDDVGMPSALRQLQDAADGAGAEILSVLPNTPQPSELDPDLSEVTVGLQVRGSYFQMVDFLRRIEDPALTARGMLTEFVVIREDEYPALAADMSLRLFSRAPVSPGTGELGVPGETLPEGEQTIELPDEAAGDAPAAGDGGQG